MKFLDLPAQHAVLQDEMETAVLEVLRSGSYILGAPVEAFEADFAAFTGTGHCIAVNTGTSALHLALLAAGIGPGDEVITTPTTFVATVAAIRYVGATPVLVDIDPLTWCIDPARIEAAITPRTRAIVPVHLHGRLADMQAILSIARAHGLRVIEDAAQAHGAERGGIRAGAFGDIGCFSFYPGKNLGAAGEGGGIVTSDPDLAHRMRRLRDWGQEGKGNHVELGFNFRMDAIQGAVLGVKLRHLDAWTEARRAVARRYDAGLAGIARPAPSDGRDHVYHVYAITVPDRDRLARALAAEGVPTVIHYPLPVHLQPGYAGLGRAGDFPNAEAYAAATLSLPMHPTLTEAETDTICQAVRRHAAQAEPIAAE